jgi:hypothetical protein
VLDREDDRDSVGDAEGVTDALPEVDSVTLMLCVALTVRELENDGVPLKLELAVKLTELEAVPETVTDGEHDRLAEDVEDGENVEVVLGVDVTDGENVEELDEVPVTEYVAE